MAQLRLSRILAQQQQLTCVVKSPHKINQDGKVRVTNQTAIELQGNQHRSFVGTVDDFRRRKGWFIGAFVDEPLLRTELVEVAWQQLVKVTPSPDQAHYHTKTVEINIIIKGTMTLTIDGARHDLSAGQFYVIWPYSVVSEIVTGPDTEVVVVRAPSIPDDKILVTP
jgi:mannose-6-phosphate isomerase-like protein (cupin superfamily)